MANEIFFLKMIIKICIKVISVEFFNMHISCSRYSGTKMVVHKRCLRQNGKTINDNVHF